MPKKTTTSKIIKSETPKKATKKTIVKKITKKDLVMPREIIYATDVESFWLADGQILNSLVALNQALLNMEKDVFIHHVAKDKNDFADWVDQVLCDKDCANSLRKCKTPASACTAVTKHLKNYKTK